MSYRPLAPTLHKAKKAQRRGQERPHGSASNSFGQLSTPSTRAHTVAASLRLSIAQHGLSSSSSTKAHQSPLRRGRGAAAQSGGQCRRRRRDDVRTTLGRRLGRGGGADLFPAGCGGDDVATADLRYALIPDLRARARRGFAQLTGRALAPSSACRKRPGALLELAAALDPEVAERDDDDTDDGVARAPSALDVRRKAIERHEAKKRSAEALAEAQRALKDAQTSEERDELERDVIIAELRFHAATCEEPLLVMIGSSTCCGGWRRTCRRSAYGPPQNADAAWLLGARPGGQNGGLRVLRMDRDDAGPCARGARRSDQASSGRLIDYRR